MQHEVGLVLDVPVDDLPFFKIHGLSHGGGKIDVILVDAALTFDQLDFCRIPHGLLLSFRA